MRPGDRDGADQESDQQAAAITEKDGSWIEVVAKKPGDGARQCQRENQYDLVVSWQRDNTSHEARKQRRTCRESIQTVNQIERVGDPEDPKNCQRQSHQPA